MSRLVRISFRVCIGIAAVGIAACNPGESPAIANTPNAPVAPAAPTIAAQTPIAKGVPHSALINEVAITEQADAAISFDMLLGIRLWPSLDGTRPPVPVSANAPKQLALSHTGRDLLAVVLDDAGSVQALRLGLDGSVRGKTTLPGQYVQAIATDSGVIVRTPDHAIEWYAPDGTPKGRVLAGPGQRLEGIATRNGHTAALVANASSGIARDIRWLTLGDTLGWGMNVEVPGPVVDGLFAIAPNNKRLAYTSFGAIEVYEIDSFAHVVKGDVVVPHIETDRGIGFIDNDEVVLAGLSQVSLWTPAKPAPKLELKPEQADDPWAVATTYVTPTPAKMSQPFDNSMTDGFAYGDGVVVSGLGVALAISTETKTRYLGWKQLAAGNLSNVGDQIVMSLSGSRFVWLDPALAVTRDVELHDSDSAPWVYGIPLDDRHVITQTSVLGRYDIALYDAETKTSSKSLSYPETERLEYSPATQLFAIGERRRINRFKLDLAANTMTKLSPIKIKGSPVTVRLFDPEKANGVTAAVIGWDTDYADYQTLTFYRAKGKPTRIHPFDGQILNEDPDGTLYVFARLGKPELRVLKDGKVVRKVKMNMAGAVTKDASRIATFDNNGAIVMTDTTTDKQLWHQQMWGAQQLLFTPDGKKLVVRGIGGIATFDATTGIRTGLECGWNFGIYDEQIGTQPPGQSLVCEDPMLQ